MASIMIGRRARVRACLVAGTLTASLVAAACSSSGADKSGSDNGEKASKVGDTLTVAISQGPLSMNPGSLSRSGNTNNYLFPAYQPLIDLDPNGKLTPSLATSWKWLDKTNTNFQLQLRKDAKFSDGTPVNAAAVVNYWKYCLATSVSKYWLGGATFETPDDYTVVVHLQKDKPRPNLDWALTPSFTSLSFITSPKGLEDPDSLKLKTDGAGPYMLDVGATVTNSQYVYVPNPYYYNKAARHWKKIIVKPMASEAARLAALQTGQVDVATGAQRQIQAAKDAGLNVIEGAGGSYTIIFGDLKGKIVPQLANVKVRQAMAHAIDWKGIVKGIFGDNAVLNQELMLKNMQGYVPELANAYPYDVDKAKELMKEAGYPDGFDAGQILIGPPVGMKELSQALQAAWAKIGIKVQPLVLDSSSWVTKLRGQPWPVNLFSSILNLVGPTVTSLFDSNSGWMKNSDFTDLYSLLQKAQETPAGTSESTKAWQAINRYIIENVLCIAGVMPTNSWFAQKDIGGVTFNPPATQTIMYWYQK